MARRFFVIAVGCLLLVSHPAPLVAQEASPGATPALPGALVDIGDRTLFLACQGSGSPTVILESGLNDGAAAWSAVQREIGASLHVCSYDRANLPGGASERASGTETETLRPASALTADLHALLESAGVPGPYVLVGHSVGGLLVRHFAATYPDEVVGMVLIDATHEQYFTRLEEIVGPDLWAALLDQFAQGVAHGALEPIDLETTVAQVQEATRTTPLSPMPLIVLSHARPFAAPMPGWPVAAEDQLWGDLQDQLVVLVPGGQHVIAADSGHDIHRERPDLVVSAIRDVVAATP